MSFTSSSCCTHSLSTANDIKSTSDHDFNPYVSCDSEDFVFKLVDECSKKARSESCFGNITIRALEGGVKGNQLQYFLLAKEFIKDHNRELYDKLVFETINNTQVKERKWTPDDVANWLINSDIHIILTHIHQGLTGVNGHHEWDIYSIETKLLELKYHRGFPNGIYLKCRIFLQDKWDYLAAVKDRVLPTLKVPLAINLDDPSVFEKISKPHNNLLVKIPYTTNQIYTKQESVEQVVRQIKKEQEIFKICKGTKNYLIPYVMVQPMLKNKKEYKVVCFNGEAIYEADISPRGVPRISFSNSTDRAKFAEESIKLLKNSCPEALVSGLIRVDIMQSDAGEMVVNEFESLEADHPYGIRSLKSYCELSRRLKMYYVDILLKFSHEILTERNLK